MRRKSTRAAAKVSPEKAKEEKSPKKTRRHSKRHKPTSSESGSEDEVSASSNDNNAQAAGELWTVTQTEPSSNDIGKLKICLARPNPATPERTERASKRLRNKPAVLVEETPPEEKPVRRTRRSRGGSSPAKKEELPQQPPQQLQQQLQLDEEVCEEKKGKGKSKGKHKSKIVEQAAHIDVKPTEMQSEISENVQVTAQSPQNVDNSDAEIVERDLSQCEDEQSVCKSGEEQSLDSQDTNDNIVDASHNDISNNNNANDSPVLPTGEQSNDASVTAADIENMQSEDSGKQSAVQSGVSPKESSDVSMEEVTHFEVCPSESDSQTEETEAAPSAKTEDAIKSEEVQVKAESELTPPTTEDETKPETKLEPVKDESSTNREVKMKEEVEEVVKQEAVPNEIDQAKLNSVPDVKCETPATDEKCKLEDAKHSVEVVASNADDTLDQKQRSETTEVPKVEAAAEEEETPPPEQAKRKEASPERSEEIVTEDVEEQAPEEQAQDFKQSEEETTEGGGEKEEGDGGAAASKVVETPADDECSSLERREGEDTVSQEEQMEEAPASAPQSPRVIEKERPEETNQRDRADETEESIPTADAQPEPEETISTALRIPQPWGESTSLPSILLISSGKLLKMYPTLTLLDESSVKLQSTQRERAQKAQGARKPTERRVSKEENRKTEARVERPEAVAATASAEPSSLALNRKISIVEDEASSLRPPPSPAKHEKSSVLFITNLVRPFTVKQLRGLLERTGKIAAEGFWTDKIKSKCYVQYETEGEAETTRNAIHGVLWPIGNGKKLIIDFATVADLEAARNPPVVAPAPAPAPVKSAPEKENHEPPKKMANAGEAEKPEAKSTQWDVRNEQDVRLRRGRSSSADRKRRHSQTRRSRSPTEDVKKKRREVPVQQRAMDDLFRKTEATPSIYWQPLQPEEIALKQQQRLERMEAHKRKMESQSRQRRNSDRQQRGGPYRRRY